MPYTISVNTPGCLPEQEPYEVETLAEARDALSTEVTRTVDAHDGPGAEEYGAQEAEAQQAIMDIGPEGGSVTVGNYVHEAIRTDASDWSSR